ncbi:hypothetical protein [Thalassomonas sp. RHCl1]|uniref:hypothetical protein n=1 Tax=Thalassomonas sp. RHCl1 TaxID=2995320 RepID=UPI00248C0FC4|nr:hypothetical protein [Thalassomonas sp. RHCl1]
MKLTLNIQKLKNLSRDKKDLPVDMTPRVGGGITGTVCGPVKTTVPTWACPTYYYLC